MKKIVIIYLLTMLLLIVAIGCNDTQNDSPDKDDNVVTDGQNPENQEENSGGEQDEIQGDKKVDENSESTIESVKFYISEKDVVFGIGFDYINDKYKETIKEFVRMSLLGYGGSASLEEIREINDRIFIQDSKNREDYVARMNAFEECDHEKYLWGWAEVEALGDLKKDNKSITLTVRIVHYLTYHNWGTYYGTIATEAGYTLKLVETSEGVQIETCQPERKNSFDGDEGTGEIVLVRPKMEFNEAEFEYPDNFEELTAEEQEVIKKFVLQLVLGDQGYLALDEVSALNEEIFHPDAEMKHDYMRHIELVERAEIIYLTCDVKVDELKMSENEGERKVEISITRRWTYGYWKDGYVSSGDESAAQYVYKLTLSKIEGKVFITNCVKHENCPY